MGAFVTRDEATGLWCARWLEDGERCSYESPNRERVLAFIAALSGVTIWRESKGVER